VVMIFFLRWPLFGRRSLFPVRDEAARFDDPNQGIRQR
jgi:hypothetical protein